MKIIAVGNYLKKDDAIALIVADCLKEFNIIKGEISPENFVKEGDSIILIDAVEFNGKVGEVRLFKGEDIKKQHFTSHNMTDAILFLSKEIFIIGIQPKELSYGEGISKELNEKILEITQKVKELILSINN